MQAYDSLALEDNSEVGAGQMLCFLPTSSTLPSMSQPKKTTRNFQNGSNCETICWLPLLAKSVDFQNSRTNCKRAWNGPEILFYGFLAQSQLPREQSWLQLCVGSKVYSCGWDNITHLIDLSPWPSWCCPLPWTQSQRADHLSSKQTYYCPIVVICIYSLPGRSLLLLDVHPGRPDLGRRLCRWADHHVPGGREHDPYFGPRLPGRHMSWGRLARGLRLLSGLHPALPGRWPAFRGK